jgi:hypothetical protein
MVPTVVVWETVSLLGMTVKELITLITFVNDTCPGTGYNTHY